MQIVIFCGGKGARLRPYTDDMPKPMIPVGDKPILWHLMKLYSQQGHKDFILCLGYMADKIKEYFSRPENREDDWNITMVDTGEDTLKGERLMMVKDCIKDDNFLLAYGDDLSDVAINDVIEFHKNNNKVVTLTSVNPISQYGILELDGFVVSKFKEKPKLDHWINGGYYVVNKKIFDFIKPGMDLEQEVFEELTSKKEIAAFKHNGFWMSMNTIKDVTDLNKLWDTGELKEILYQKKI